VFVVNVSDDQMPLRYLVHRTKDTQLQKDFLAREKQLLYVSLTRARDELFITWNGQVSKFLS